MFIFQRRNCCSDDIVRSDVEVVAFLVKHLNQQARVLRKDEAPSNDWYLVRSAIGLQTDHEILLKT